MKDGSLTLLLMQIVLVKSVLGQSNCVDPKNFPGRCVSIKFCPEIQDMLRRTLFEDDFEFLQNVRCQNGVGDPPHVCCKSTVIEGRITNEDDVDNLLPKSNKCGPPGSNNKILFGTEAELGEYPWMALLEYETPGGVSTDCAGSLISHRYVLTAAHCVEDTVIRRRGNVIGVRLGEHYTTTDPDCIDGDCADPVVRIPVEEIILHEGFRRMSKNGTYDIALLRLAHNVNFTDFVKPICLPSVVEYEPLMVGYKVFVAGWGTTENGTRSISKQKLDLSIANFRECQLKYAPRRQHLSDSQFCAASEKKGADACLGDSGGPVMYLTSRNWVLEGIVSFGFGCGTDHPGVYTKVSVFDSWIRSKIRP